MHFGRWFKLNMVERGLLKSKMQNCHPVSKKSDYDLLQNAQDIEIIFFDVDFTIPNLHQ
jgi:hypothetical protein